MSRSANTDAEMETMQQALERLERKGFEEAFRARHDGLLVDSEDRVHRPEAFTVEEVVRFEGISSPGDEAILFALRAHDGTLRGTLVSAFGPAVEPGAAEVLHQLDLTRRSQQLC